MKHIDRLVDLFIYIETSRGVVLWYFKLCEFDRIISFEYVLWEHVINLTSGVC